MGDHTSAAGRGGGDEPTGRAEFVRRVLTVAAVASLVVIAFLLLAYAPNAVILTFAAVWFGCVVYHASAFVARRTGLSDRWAMGVVVTLVVLFAVGFVLLLGLQIAGQVNRLAQNLTEATAQLQQRLEEYPQLQRLVQRAPSAGEAAKAMGGSGSIVTDVLTTPLGLAVNVLFIFFTGVYFAVSPDLYADGAARLFPPRRRPAVRAVLTECGAALWRWTLARLFSMALVGTLAGVGLYLLGIPMAATLGLATALFIFVPNVGPVVATIPPLLLAFTQGGWTPLYVLALYVGIELIESWIITPIIHEKEDALPAAIVLVAQLVFAVLFGLLGVTFAMPIALVAMILVQRLYVDATLEGRDVREQAATSDRLTPEDREDGPKAVTTVADRR